MPQFHIRSALEDPADGEFLLAAFDAALPHLAAIGSEGQWGSIPWSTLPVRCAGAHSLVTRSEHFRLTGAGDPLRLFIAEAEVPADRETGGLYARVNEEGKKFVGVAAGAVHEGYFPEYVARQPQFEEMIKATKESGGDIYVELMISDYRAGELRKGSGAVVMGALREYAVMRGAKTLFLDCWAGNGGKLAGFYESLGFVKVDEFVGERPDEDPWHGMVLRMDLP